MGSRFLQTPKMSSNRQAKSPTGQRRFFVRSSAENCRFDTSWSRVRRVLVVMIGACWASCMARPWPPVRHVFGTCYLERFSKAQPFARHWNYARKAPWLRFGVSPDPLRNVRKHVNSRRVYAKSRSETGSQATASTATIAIPTSLKGLDRHRSGGPARRLFYLAVTIRYDDRSGVIRTVAMSKATCRRVPRRGLVVSFYRRAVCRWTMVARSRSSLCPVLALRWWAATIRHGVPGRGAECSRIRKLELGYRY